MDARWPRVRNPRLAEEEFQIGHSQTSVSICGNAKPRRIRRDGRQQHRGQPQILRCGHSVEFVALGSQEAETVGRSATPQLLPRAIV
jgi:hypothetical protein